MKFYFFFFNDTATTEIYTVPYTLSLHDALPISCSRPVYSTSSCSSRKPGDPPRRAFPRSEEQTSELQSHGTISYAVFCLKKKKKKRIRPKISNLRKKHKIKHQTTLK